MFTALSDCDHSLYERAVLSYRWTEMFTLRDAIDPHGFVRRHGNVLTRWVGVVRNDGLDSCLR